MDTIPKLFWKRLEKMSLEEERISELWHRGVKQGEKRYVNAHAKVETWIFNLKIPGKCNNFDIISNDFKSSTN